MRSKVGALAVCLLLASVARSAPLDAKQVAADAKWVVHVDVDAMRGSLIVQNAYHALVEKHPMGKIGEAILDKSRQMIGMDPRTDLHGITAYGSKIGKEEGVLILAADVDQKLLLDKVQKAPDHKTASYGSYELHSWTHRDHRGARPVTGVFFKPNVLVFSGCVDEVKAALDVLDGKAKSVAGPLAAAVPAGSTVIVRAVGLGEAATPHCPPVAKEFKDLSIAMGECDGKSFFCGKLTVTSKDVAEELKDVVVGIRALGLLHAADAPDQALAKALKVSCDEGSVSADFEAPATAVWEHIQKDAKRMIEFHKKHGPPHGGPAHHEKK